MKSFQNTKNLSFFFFVALVVTVLLSKRKLIDIVDIADISLIIIIALFAIFSQKNLLEINKRFLIFFSIITFLVGGFLLVRNHPDISFSNFYPSILKLALYFFTIHFFLTNLDGFSNQRIKHFFKKLVLILFGISVYIFVNQHLDLYGYFHLPYKFIWFLQGEISHDGGTIGLVELFGIKIAKPRSVFLEPSYYSIFLMFSYAIINFKNNQPEKFNFIILINLILTFSLTGLMGCCGIFCLELYKIRKTLFSNKFFIFCIFFLSIFFSLYLSNIKFSHIADKLIFDRVIQIFLGKDKSALKRIDGSIFTAYKALKFNTFFGSSLGNLSNFEKDNIMIIIAEEGEHLELKNYMSIMPLYFLGSTGLIGFTIFIVLISKIIFVSKEFFVAFLILFFSSGGGTELTFYIFILISLLMKKNLKIKLNVN